MLLYDLYYPGSRSIKDSSVPLPDDTDRDTVAVCVNGEPRRLVRTAFGWVLLGALSEREQRRIYGRHGLREYARA